NSPRTTLFPYTTLFRSARDSKPKRLARKGKRLLRRGGDMTPVFCIPRLPSGKAQDGTVEGKKRERDHSGSFVLNITNGAIGCQAWRLVRPCSSSPASLILASECSTSIAGRPNDPGGEGRPGAERRY